MPRRPLVLVACRAVERANPPHGFAPVEARRAQIAQQPVPQAVPAGLVRSEHVVPVAGGSIPVRVHAPAGAGRRPAHLLLHGGGFCYGAPHELDDLAALYAGAAGCVVVAPGYRVAPEHPYPTPPEDGYASLTWLVRHAAELGVDPARISVGGLSAGGCLAAAVALMARDRGGPALTFQLLEIPITDVTASSRSVERYGTGHVLTRAELLQNYASYVPDPARRREAYASPLFAADLRGLPPALVVTAECDPLRDEGEAYARRLRAAGVPTQLIRARGHVHSSTYTGLPSARRVRQRAADALARAHAGGPDTAD